MCSNRRLRRELEESEAAHGRTTAKYRNALAEVRSSLVAMQQQARNRSDQAATLAHATFAHLQVGPRNRLIPPSPCELVRAGTASPLERMLSDLSYCLGRAPSLDSQAVVSSRPSTCRCSRASCSEVAASPVLRARICRRPRRPYSDGCALKCARVAVISWLLSGPRP